jgi:DNA polymerase-1
MPRPTFYIIDGHAHIYRSYFAPFRELTSPTGEPTKATFVFTQMLLNLVDQRKPDYLAVVIDHGDETVFRKSIYPEYKANRASRPPDFLPQEQRIFRIVRDSGLPMFEVPGFEADDIIATMALKLKDDYEVFMVSKDKDLRQMLSEHVSMYDVQGDELITPAKLKETKGYGPELAIQVQTLIGDPTDNVPGIPGVGEKTAVQLLNDFGSIDAIYNSLDKLKSKKKLVENLQNNRDKLELSRQLVTLRTDVAFDFSIDACKFQGFNVDGIAKHLNELGFRNLLERVRGKAKAVDNEKPIEGGLFGGGGSPAASNAKSVADLPSPEKQPINIEAPDTSKGLPYEIIDTKEKLATFITELRKHTRIAIDTETDSERPTNANLVGISISWAPKTGAYIAVKGPMGCKWLDLADVIPDLAPIFADPKVQKVGQNLKYDVIVLQRHGLPVNGIVSDTMLAGFLLDASQNSFGIDSLALRYLNFKKISTSEVIGSGKNQTTMDCVDIAAVGHYAAEDVDVCLRLDELFAKKLEPLPAVRKLYDELEVPLVEVLATMEANGIRVDPAVLKEQSNVLADRVEILRTQIFTAVGSSFNPDSPKQLADVLFTQLKLPPMRKTKTGYSTDVEVLEKLAEQHAVPKLILEYRSLVKLKNTYLDNLPGDINPSTGRIHTSFNMTGAATGRLSSSDPNLQNIPIRTDEGRRIRLAFVSAKDHSLVVADYSQIELRILAHFTEEPALLRAFENDEDIHEAVACEVFGVTPEQVTKELRTQAKTINFGIIYGVTPMGLVRRIDGLDYKRADELIKTYNARFPSIDRFMQECVMKAKSDGYVETILGRRRPLPDINSGVINIRNMNERMAINSVVQGSAADLIKQAMLNLHRRIQREKLPAKMLLQVHDELVVEAPDSEAPCIAEILKEEMTGAMKLKAPIKVEVGIGKNWDEAK